MAIGSATNVKLTIQQINKETIPKTKLMIDCFFIITHSPFNLYAKKREAFSRSLNNKIFELSYTKTTQKTFITMTTPIKRTVWSF